MKRLYVALAILAAVFAATLCNAYFLNHLTSGITSCLDQAEERARDGDWRGAAELTEQANRLWESHTLYLHISLRHNDIDDVETNLHEVWEYLRAEDSSSYAAANARLSATISMIYEAEQLSIKNIL